MCHTQSSAQLAYSSFGTVPFAPPPPSSLMHSPQLIPSRPGRAPPERPPVTRRHFRPVAAKGTHFSRNFGHSKSVCVCAIGRNRNRIQAGEFPASSELRPTLRSVAGAEAAPPSGRDSAQPGLSRWTVVAAADALLCWSCVAMTKSGR